MEEPFFQHESQKETIKRELFQPTPFKVSPLEITAAEHPKMHKNLIRLTISVTLISLSSFYFGFCLTYMSTIPSKTLKEFYGSIIEKESTIPILEGAMPIGAIFGSLLAEVLMRKFTRKYTYSLFRNFIIFVNSMAIVVNIIIQITNIWVLLTCRIFQGVFVGLYMAIVPIYIHEITPHSLSGIFGAFTQMQHLIGNVISYLIGMIFYLCGNEGELLMRFQYEFTSIFILMQIIGIAIGYLPESPNSLIESGKIEEAKNIIALFNQESEIEQIVAEKLIENQSKANPNPNPSTPQIKMSTKSFILGFELPFSQQLTGVNFLVTQLTSITSIYNQSLSHFTALIANTVQLISTSLSTLVLKKYGRRTIILSGNLGIGILNLIIGGVFYASWEGWKNGFGVSMGLIMIFNVIFGLTLGPVVWIYVPEIVTQKIVPLATATYWCGCSLCVIVAPIVTSKMNSPYAVFMFLGAYLILVFIPNWFLVVETKGRTAVEISREFAGKSFDENKNNLEDTYDEIEEKRND